MNTNDIEFLPEWYRIGRRNRRLLRNEYFAAAILLVVVVVCDIFLTGSLSRVNTAIALDSTKSNLASKVCEEYSNTTEKIKEYQNKAAGFSKLRSVVNVGDIIAELSYLIGDKIAVSKLELKAESFGKSGLGTSGKGSFRVASGKGSRSEGFLSEDVRFRIFLSGVSRDSADVAELVCKMEDSDYFCQVVPSFSGNLKTNFSEGSKDKSNISTQFEIYSYLGNYRIENIFAVGKAKKMVSHGEI